MFEDFRMKSIYDRHYFFILHTLWPLDYPVEIYSNFSKQNYLLEFLFIFRQQANLCLALMHSMSLWDELAVCQLHTQSWTCSVCCCTTFISLLLSSFSMNAHLLTCYNVRSVPEKRPNSFWQNFVDLMARDSFHFYISA